MGRKKAVFHARTQVQSRSSLQGRKKGDEVFYGHFHKADVCQIDGVIYVCVGAIGMPKADTVRSYAVVDEHEISVKSLVGEDVLFRFEI